MDFQGMLIMHEMKVKEDFRGMLYGIPNTTLNEFSDENHEVSHHSFRGDMPLKTYPR